MKINAEESAIQGSQNFLQIIKGSVLALVLGSIFLLIFSVILTYTSVAESTMVPVIIVITAISILIGSSISTIKIKKNGILNGAAIGGIYMLVIYLISSIVSGNFGFNTSAIIMLISGILAGMLGGIVGVNRK